MTTSAMPALPPRANVLGVGVHGVNMTTAVRAVERAVREGRKGCVCVTGVHGVSEAQHDEALRRIHNRAFLVVPDGMPMVWVGRLQGLRDMGRVYGPDLMMEICRRSVDTGASHFLYGGREGVAAQLADVLRSRFPGIRIAGVFTPPFRPLDAAEEQELVRQVAETRPDYFWIGLGTPKQERFAAAWIDRLDTRVMLGVGAAFDLHTGRIQDAPAWMKSSGLQWLHRLVQEPRRLARRYLVNNPLFVARILLQFAGLRRRSLDG
ncbi:MAG: WecB/TagA/CpsF family glycosyltransferase [Kiritimatiellia bacterium]